MDRLVSRKMIVQKLLWMLCFSNFLQIYHGVSVTIRLDGYNGGPYRVSVIEGNNLTLSCVTNETQDPISWSKTDDTGFFREGGQLFIETVRINHGGEYNCVILEQNGSEKAKAIVEVHVLYPPGRVDISGPTSALKEDIFNLTCRAISNPDPSYLWSYNASGTPVVYRGPMLPDIKHQELVSRIYCFAETTMIQTQGESVTSTVYRDIQVTEHVPAAIRFLQDNFTIEEGSLLDATCETIGAPTPTVHWFKYGSNETVNEGERFLVPNAGVDLDGAYTCTAENIITDVTGNSKRAYASSKTLFRVLTKAITTYAGVCPTVCTYVPGNIWSRIDIANTINRQEPPELLFSITIVEKNETSTYPVAEKTCSIGIFAALAIGWICVLILLLIGIFFYIRVRVREVNNSPPSIHHMSAAIRDQENPNDRAALPTSDLQASNDGYLTPRSDQEIPGYRAALPTSHMQASSDGYLSQARLGNSTSQEATENPYPTETSDSAGRHGYFNLNSTSQEAASSPYPTETTDSAGTSNHQYDYIQ